MKQRHIFILMILVSVILFSCNSPVGPGLPYVPTTVRYSLKGEGSNLSVSWRECVDVEGRTTLATNNSVSLPWEITRAATRDNVANGLSQFLPYLKVVAEDNKEISYDIVIQSSRISGISKGSFEINVAILEE